MGADIAHALGKFYEHSVGTSNDVAQYLNLHSSPEYINNTVQTFRFYEQYLPSGRILDWGCRHAAEAFMIRIGRGASVELHGCDVFDSELHRSFHEEAGVEYRRLNHPYLLPYYDATFDAVVGSGVIEHVPFDAESMKELYRILKPSGRLILTWVPNAISIGEWWLRRAGQVNILHWRRYSKSQLTQLLLHHGFRPLIVGYQDRLDLLPLYGGNYRVSGSILRLVRPFVRALGMHRIVGGLCAVGEKVESI